MRNFPVKKSLRRYGNHSPPLPREPQCLHERPGGSDGAPITAEEIAEIIGTIPWDVVTSISRRVPRFYREP